MKHVLLALVLLAGFFWSATRSVSSLPYSYDEADYMFAASRGFASNYLDTPAQSFPEFLRTGLSRGRDASQKAALSQYIRDSGDLNFYRHWHGPVYYYWLVFLRSAAPHLSERGVRTFSLVFPALSVLVVYFGSIWLFSGSWTPYAAFLAAAITGWSAVATLSTELAPHQLFTLLYLSALFLIAKSIETGQRNFWYGAVVLTALSMATLEVGLILAFTLALLGVWQRKRLAADWRFALQSLALLVVSLAAVWPGALLKLAFLKAYLFMAYLAVFRKAAWGATFGEAWAARAALAPVEWLLLAFAVVLFIRHKEVRDRRTLPFLVFGVLMLLFLLKVNSSGARYMLPFLPAFSLFAVFTLLRFEETRTQVFRPAVAFCFVAFACLALLLNTGRVVQNRAGHSADPRPSSLLAEIHSQGWQEKKLLVPQEDLPMLHYYFPSGTFIPYEESTGVPATASANAVLSSGYPVRITPIRITSR